MFANLIKTFFLFLLKLDTPYCVYNQQQIYGAAPGETIAISCSVVSKQLAKKLSPKQLSSLRFTWRLNDHDKITILPPNLYTRGQLLIHPSSFPLSKHSNNGGSSNSISNSDLFSSFSGSSLTYNTNYEFNGAESRNDQNKYKQEKHNQYLVKPEREERNWSKYNKHKRSDLRTNAKLVAVSEDSGSLKYRKIKEEEAAAEAEKKKRIKRSNVNNNNNNSKLQSNVNNLNYYQSMNYLNGNERKENENLKVLNLKNQSVSFQAFSLINSDALNFNDDFSQFSNDKKSSKQTISGREKERKDHYPNYLQQNHLNLDRLDNLDHNFDVNSNSLNSNHHLDNSPSPVHQSTIGRDSSFNNSDIYVSRLNLDTKL